MAPFSVSERTSGDERALELVGELDMTGAPALLDAVARACADDPAKVIFDIGQLDFIDSTGLRALLAGRETCQAQGCEVEITHSDGQVDRLFEIAGINFLQTPARDSEPAGS